MIDSPSGRREKSEPVGIRLDKYGKKKNHSPVGRSIKNKIVFNIPKRKRHEISILRFPERRGQPIHTPPKTTENHQARTQDQAQAQDPVPCLPSPDDLKREVRAAQRHRQDEVLQELRLEYPFCRDRGHQQVERVQHLGKEGIDRDGLKNGCG